MSTLSNDTMYLCVFLLIVLFLKCIQILGSAVLIPGISSISDKDDDNKRQYQIFCYIFIRLKLET